MQTLHMSNSHPEQVVEAVELLLLTLWPLLLRLLAGTRRPLESVSKGAPIEPS